MFEELGAGFTLLALDADAVAVTAFERSAEALRVPLHVVRDTFSDGREAYERQLILVRPDQFIAWTGNELPAQPSALLERVTGQVPA